MQRQSETDAQGTPATAAAAEAAAETQRDAEMAPCREERPPWQRARRGGRGARRPPAAAAAGDSRGASGEAGGGGGVHGRVLRPVRVPARGRALLRGARVARARAGLLVPRPVASRSGRAGSECLVVVILRRGKRQHKLRPDKRGGRVRWGDGRGDRRPITTRRRPAGAKLALPVVCTDSEKLFYPSALVDLPLPFLCCVSMSENFSCG
jgi:hypothetical protein